MRYLTCAKRLVPYNTKPMQTIKQFFSDGNTTRYKKGEMILRSDDVPTGIYYLAHGNVRQYILSPSGEQFIIHIYKAGSYFPLSWILNDAPNNFYFDAVKDVTILKKSKEQFLSFLKQDPQALLFTAQKLAAGLSGMALRFGHLITDNAYTKTVSLLVYFARNYGKKEEYGTLLQLPLAHREIASWIGTTRETVSIAVESLKKQGLVKTIGRSIVIPNIEQLEAHIVQTK